MLRNFLQATLLAVIAASAIFSTGALTARAAFPQPSWPDNDSVDVERCTSPGGPQNLASSFVFFGLTGPGAMVNGNYIGFVCNFQFTRSGTGYTAGVAVTVDYCGGSVQADRREEGNYTTEAGEFTVRLQRWVSHGGAVIVIVLYTNNHGSDDFNLTEMTQGSKNLADLNRPQGAVPCPGGGTTQNPGGGTGGPWSIALTADATNLIAGNDFTLTATASQNVAGTGFAIFIVDQTEGVTVFCSAVKVCTHKDYKNEPGVRNYIAFVAKSPGVEVQATSAPLAITWQEWSGSITLATESDTVNSGDVVYLTATATPTINASIYMIRIERQDNGQGGNCLESPCTKSDYYEFGVTHNYVAKVLKNDGTNLRGTSSPLKVTWKATEEWNGTAGVRLAGGVDRVGIGVLVTIEAYASPDLEGTDYVLQIVEQVAGGGGQNHVCAEGSFERCAMAVTSSEETTRFFLAQVVRRDGTGGVKAVSAEPATITWAPFATIYPCNDGWTVKEVTGNASVLVGGTNRVPLKVGQWICPRDMVETGPDGKIVGEFEERGLFNPRAGPEFGLKAKIEVKPSTQLTLDFFPQSVHHTIVNLNSGGAEFFIDGIAKSDFRIKSPTAVASVRGTVLSVEVEPGSGKTTVTSYEHEVVVTPENPDLDEVSLFGGDRVTIGASTQSPVTKIFGPLPHKRRLPAVGREGSDEPHVTRAAQRNGEASRPPRFVLSPRAVVTSLR